MRARGPLPTPTPSPAVREAIPAHAPPRGQCADTGGFPDVPPLPPHTGLAAEPSRCQPCRASWFFEARLATSPFAALLPGDEAAPRARLCSFSPWPQPVFSSVTAGLVKAEPPGIEILNVQTVVLEGLRFYFLRLAKAVTLGFLNLLLYREVMHRHRKQT